MYKILIADDHEMVREGVKSLIRTKNDLTLVGECNSGHQTIELYRLLQPDVLILDISLPDMNGMDISREILADFPAANIIIFSMHSDEEYISKCMEFGVKGFVIKNESSRELELSIYAALKGNTYFSRQVQDVIFKKFTTSVRRVESPAVTLTKREIEIIKLLSEGLTSQEMADKLFISTRTVETHRANVMKKLNAKNSIELVKKSQAMKLLG